jgi:hypothetical protein
MEGTESSARLAQFLSLRRTIETVASHLFDDNPLFRGSVVKIFAKHVAGGPCEAAPNR